MEKNQLYYGDNLEVMRRYIPNESVDLVYLDPPFNSNATYNVLFAEQDGSRSSAQIEAFGDTWRWDESAVEAFQSTVVRGGPVSDALRAFYTLLGDSNMMAYIAMMAPRLVELRRVLKPDGSLYLHCDPTASHYLKLLLDAVFGPHRFRSQITWQRTNAHSDSKDWSEVSDILLYFVKGERYTWNPTYQKHSDEYVASKYRYRDADGRIYRLGDMTSPSPRPNMMYEWKGHASPPLGWRYSKETMARLDAENRIWYPDDKKKRPQLKRYLDQMAGTLLTNIWTDIDPLNSQARERLGYPTQKPEALLDRILKASSNEGDVVLDPFCGCGTAVASAQRLGRRWIGIDITHLAINLIKSRLRDTHGDEVTQTYEVIGEPTTVSGARALAIQDRYQFQWWALGLVGARLAEVKKGADKGIDGRLFFYDDHGAPKQIILSVKSGGVSVKDVRELQAVIEREKAAIGALITLEPSTTPMRVEAAGSGRYEAAGWGSSHPRLQVVTIAELLAGKRLDYPAAGQRGATYKEAPRLRAAGGSQAALPLGD